LEAIKTKKHRALKITGICVGVIVIILVAGIIYINNMLGKVKYEPVVDNPTIVEPPPDDDDPSIGDDDPTTKENSTQQEIDDLGNEIKENINNSDTQLMSNEKVFNVLLIGSDSRSGTGYGNSDTMILVSINKETKKIVMTSFLRDIYISIPGSGNSRLNSAYARGGASLLIQTIQDNFKVKIDRYASIYFMDFIDVIDKVGGVTITVTDEEFPYLNRYVQNINSLKGLPKDDGLLPAAGENLLLTGKQALGYARIRCVGTDFARTQRQRTILNQVFNKTKKLNLIEQNNLMNVLLPDITTNMGKGELLSLLLNMTTYANYSVEQVTIPFNGGYKNLVINGQDVLGLDFAANIAQIQQAVYGG
jgi:LCP family protein required for cell wall assembly